MGAVSKPVSEVFRGYPREWGLWVDRVRTSLGGKHRGIVKCTGVEVNHKWNP